jgi:hypothetical protein
LSYQKTPKRATRRHQKVPIIRDSLLLKRNNISTRKPVSSSTSPELMKINNNGHGQYCQSLSPGTRSQFCFRLSTSINAMQSHHCRR